MFRILLLTLLLLIGCSDTPPIDDGTATPECDDSDGDGSCSPDDCDDGDPRQYPGSGEACDGLDNDCDGQVDEDVGSYTSYPDSDGDGFAGVATCHAEYAAVGCSVPGGYATTCGDCDDLNPRAYPGAADGCDTIDSDCDSYVAEECPMPTLPSPIDVLCIPNAPFLPSNLTTTAPTGAEANATFDQLGAEIIPGGTYHRAYPVATGEPTAASTSVTVGVQQPGGVDGAGAYTVTDSGTEIGCTPLTRLTGVQTIRSVGSGSGYQHARPVAMPDGRVLVVHDQLGNTPGMLLWTPSSSTVSNVSALDSTSNVATYPDVVRIPTRTGYQYLAGYLHQTLNASTDTLEVRFSLTSDPTGSWDEFTSDLSFDTTTISREALRLAYDPVSKNLLLGVLQNNAGTYTGKYYVSTDLGGTWTYLSGSDISTARSHDIKSWGGMFYVAVLQDEATDIVRFRKMSGAAEGWGTAVDVSTSTITQTCLAFTITPDGVFWIDYRENATPGDITRAYSTDRGQTWTDVTLIEEMNSGYTTGLVFTGSVYTTGELHLIGNILSSGTTRDNSLVALKGGGWSTLTNDLGANGYDAFWPSDIPATRSTQHVFTTGGASAESITADTATNPQIVYDISNDNSTGFITTTFTAATQMFGHGALWILSPDSSGGSTSSDAIALRIGANTTGSGNDVEAGLRINMTSRSVQAYDWNAAGNLGSAQTWSTAAPVEFWVHVDYLGDGTNSKMSAYVRLSTSRTWTTIVEDQTLTRGAGSTLTMRWGKLSASTANVKTIAFLPFFRGNGTRTTGDTSPPLLGRTATTTPDRTPWGAHLHWRSSPLVAGETWTLRARSDHPVSFTSPFSVAPSPLRDWRGDTVSAGATIRVAVYDFGSSYVGKLSRNLVWLGWANTPDVATVRLRYWTGAAWSDVVSASTLATAFTDGATGIGRSAATTYLFFPRSGTSNTGPRLWGHNEHKGRWCWMSDGGGNTLAGRILTNSAGQFTGAADAVEATLELDPSTVTVLAGTFAGFSTSTATGSLRIYADQGIAIGTQTSDATRYYLLEITMAPGATTPSSGLLAAGTAIPLARAYRAGASVSYQTDPRLDRVLRKVEYPYDALLVPGGTGVTTSAPKQTGLTIGAGTTERATVDNNESVVISALRTTGALHGQRRGVPVGLVLGGSFSDDPGNSTQVFVGDDVMFGYLARSIDVTASQGYLYPRAITRDHSKHGLSLTVDEAGLWMPTV